MQITFKICWKFKWVQESIGKNFKDWRKFLDFKGYIYLIY